MKPKALIIGLLILLSVVSVCGCKAQEATPTPDAPKPAGASGTNPAEQSDASVTVRRTDDLPDEYEEFTADTSEPQVKVLFSTDGVATDFKLLALTLDEVDEDGKMSFVSEEIYALDALTAERPLAASLAFTGAVPNNGFSYVDASGEKRSVALTESGQDGSLLLIEF